jgi:ankyrin repeat protein
MDTRQQVLSAISAGNLEQLQQALAQDPNSAAARDANGVSAIMLTLYHRRAEMTPLLQQTHLETDIFEATSLGQSDRVRQLLSGDASLVSTFSPDGFTALHFAAFFSQESTGRLLIEAGAAVDLASRNAMQVHPLHSAATARSLGMVRLLLEHGADPNARQHGGWVPIHSAAQSGDLKIVELLIQHGADTKLMNDSGVDALRLAEKGHSAIANLLRPSQRP